MLQFILFLETNYIIYYWKRSPIITKLLVLYFCLLNFENLKYLGVLCQ
jgi:hypothetical protein